MKNCIVCKSEIHQNAKKCIHCEEYQNYRRHLKFPQNALALLVALTSVLTVLIPILRTNKVNISEDKVKFSWLYADQNNITILLHNESDEDAFIQEVYFLNPKDSTKLFLNRYSRKPIIPKKKTTSYEIPVPVIDLIKLKENTDHLVLWINWTTAKNEYAYTLQFCDNTEQCQYGLDRISPLIEFNRFMEFNQKTVTDLYFGKNTPNGNVTDEVWKNFKDSIISTRFNGYSELFSKGVWTNMNGVRINENTSLIRIIHNQTEKDLKHIDEIINIYKNKFNQESVLQTRNYNTEIEFK